MIAHVMTVCQVMFMCLNELADMRRTPNSADFGNFHAVGCTDSFRFPGRCLENMKGDSRQVKPQTPPNAD